MKRFIYLKGHVTGNRIATHNRYQLWFMIPFSFRIAAYTK